MFENFDEERFQEALEELKDKALDLSEKAQTLPGKISDATANGREKLRKASEVLGINKGIEKGKEAISDMYHRYGENTKEVLDLYHLLDEEDRAIIRGEMKAMLRNSKYLKK